MLMRGDAPPVSVVSAASLLRAPVLATAVLAGGALPLLAQSQAGPGALPGAHASTRSGTHPAMPTLSCAEVTALRQGGGLPADGVIVAPAPAAAPAPAPPPQDRREAVTMGKPAIPQWPVRGTVRLPRGRTVRNGLVEAYNNQGFSKSMEVRPDGSFAGALPPGKYWLRAEVRGDDAELYATVDGITLLNAAVTHDMMLQGPVTVTAGVPAVAPQPKPVPQPKSERR